MKKKHKNLRKRTTFWKLFAKSGAVALVAAGLFAFYFHNYELERLETAMPEYFNWHYESLMEIANDKILTPEKKLNRAESRVSLSYIFPGMEVGPVFNECFRDAFWCDEYEDTYSYVALLDEHGNLVASNQENFFTDLIWGHNDSASYFGDAEKLAAYPELKALWMECEDLRNGADDDANYYHVIMESVYVNKEAHTFVPQKLALTKQNGPFTSNTEIIKEVSIEMNDSVFESYPIYQKNSADEQYPQTMMFGYYGTEKSIYEVMPYEMQFETSLMFPQAMNEAGFSRISWNYEKGREQCGMSKKITINDKDYAVFYFSDVNFHSPSFRKVYLTYTLIVLGIFLLIALLWSWQKNVRNQANYAFEDYQKALTNNLAHDIKTPLTAIGGYTENVKKMLEKGETREAGAYLDSILENVAYTDSIVNETLELSQINEMKNLKKENVNVRNLADSAAGKYGLMLAEKSVTIQIKGESEWLADAKTLTSAVENLISNAVKYTPNGGTIAVSVEKDAFTVTNDVAENVDTTDLNKPFVKGDAARSGKLGCGLGLAIVQSAADINGLQLELSCKDKKFTALLKNK